MSTLKVDAIRHNSATSDAITTAADGTCTANITNIHGRNKIINGNFDVWQRTTSVTFGAGSQYVADRWACGGAASTTVSRLAFTLGQTDVPYEPEYYLQSAWTANSQNYEIVQKIEGVRTLAGQKATVSFWIKRSAGTVGLSARLVQYFGTGGSPSTTGITGLGTPTLTTSWQKLTYTVDVPSLSGKTIGTNNDDSLWFSLQVNNANTGTIQLAQVQVEKGNCATDFEHRSVGEELSRCYRYFQVLSRNTSAGLNSHSRYPALGNGTNSTLWYCYHKQTMRVRPSLVTSNITSTTVEIFNYSTSGGATYGGSSMAEGDENHSQITVTTTGGVSSGHVACWRFSNNGDCYWAVSAEL